MKEIIFVKHAWSFASYYSNVFWISKSDSEALWVRSEIAQHVACHFMYLIICCFFSYLNVGGMEQRPCPPHDFFWVSDKSRLNYPQLGLIRQMICVMECLNIFCAPKWFPFVRMRSERLLSEVLSLRSLCTLRTKVNCWIGQTAKSLSQGCRKFTGFHLREKKKNKNEKQLMLILFCITLPFRLCYILSCC